MLQFHAQDRPRQCLCPSLPRLQCLMLRSQTAPGNPSRRDQHPTMCPQTFKEDKHHKENHLVSPTEATGRLQMSRTSLPHLPPPPPQAESKATLTFLLIAKDPGSPEVHWPPRQKVGHISWQPSSGLSVPKRKRAADSGNACTRQGFAGSESLHWLLHS